MGHPHRTLATGVAARTCACLGSITAVLEFVAPDVPANTPSTVAPWPSYKVATATGGVSTFLWVSIIGSGRFHLRGVCIVKLATQSCMKYVEVRHHSMLEAWSAAIISRYRSSCKHAQGCVIDAVCTESCVVVAANARQTRDRVEGPVYSLKEATEMY